MIESWHVREALRPRLGSALVEDPGFCEIPTRVLNAWAPYRSSFADLAAQLEDSLFNAMYERLGPGMSARMDDGVSRRIRTSELGDAADDVIGVLFDNLKVYSVNYDALHAYCMETGSFSALRTLYTRFRDFVPEAERRMMARIIRDNYPPCRWESWLLPEDLS